jgi:hypothetical protein
MALIALPGMVFIAQEVAGHLNRISSNQVRNVGSWTGNLMIAYEYPNFASDGILALAGACVRAWPWKRIRCVCVGSAVGDCALSRHLGGFDRSDILSPLDRFWRVRQLSPAHPMQVVLRGFLVFLYAGIGAILTIQRSARRGDEYHVEVRDLQKIKLGTTDVIVSVFVPYGSPRMQLKYYKAAARHRNAHAAVNAGFSVVMDDYLVRAACKSTLHGS